MTTIEQLDILIRASYPIIYIVSYEEARVKEHLKELSVKRKRQFVTWSCTQGLINIEGNKEFKENNTTDPLEALAKINDKLVPEPPTGLGGILWVLADFHPYMDDPIVIRSLKEIADKIKTIKGKTLILLSPILKLPVELEKQITVLDWPLPNQTDIGIMLDTAIEDMKQVNLTIKLENGEREKIIKSCSGLTGDEVENVLTKSVVQNKTIDIKTIIEEKKQIVRKSGILEYFDVVEDLNNVGGLDNIKSWMLRRSKAFTDKAKEFGLSFPKGVLLLGVQGCGKSLICKAVASLWKLPLIKLDMGKVFEGVVGGSENKINRALMFAESIAPCILYLDEIDKGFAGMGSSNFSDAGTTARVIGTFLTWMQEKKSPVFIIATANDISNLPPELLRKGRFDETFFVDLPTLEERKEIFNIHLKKRKRDPNKFTLDLLAKTASNFSGAEIEAAVEEGMFTAFDEGAEVNTEHITKALTDTVPLSKTMEEKIEGLRKWAGDRARLASSKEVVTVVGGRRAIEM